MNAKPDRGPLDDLEAMLDRSLKLEASPPRWQAAYQQPAYSPNQSGGRGFPQRVPVPNSHHTALHGATRAAHASNATYATHGVGSPPKAVYSSGRPQETQAVPSPLATRGMRVSGSQQSLASPVAAAATSPGSPLTASSPPLAPPGAFPHAAPHAAASVFDPREMQRQRDAARDAARAEAQRQQHILHQQQLEQQRIEQQRFEQQLAEQQRREQQRREQQQAAEYQYLQRSEQQRRDRLDELAHQQRVQEQELAQLRARENSYRLQHSHSQHDAYGHGEYGHGEYAHGEYAHGTGAYSAYGTRAAGTGTGTGAVAGTDQMRVTREAAYEAALEREREQAAKQAALEREAAAREHMARIKQQREQQLLERREDELRVQEREQEQREQQAREAQIREHQAREHEQVRQMYYRPAAHLATAAPHSLVAVSHSPVAVSHSPISDVSPSPSPPSPSPSSPPTRSYMQAQIAETRLREAKAREAQADRDGAATMVQRTQDASGKVVTRVVKKGVEDFDFKDDLGAGSYSTVVAAQDKQTLRNYAIKVLDKAHIIKEQKVKYVEIEKNTLNRLGDHPGIIKLYFTFQDRQSLYFVLDFAPNGELLHLIKKIGSLNEESARYYACQLLDAVDYMHAKGVIHRDLKPENILLDYKMRIKITDFGTAKLLPAETGTTESGTSKTTTTKYPADVRANSFVGTAEYVTPELLMDKSQGKSADIWAWGCVLYQMIAASPPFQGNTQYLTFQKIARLQYSIPPGFPYVVRDLLKHVLVKAPQRWTSAEIKAHEFFDGQDWSRKALWTTPPPRLAPYRATVASMKPRALGGRPHARPAKAANRRPMAASASAHALTNTNSNNSTSNNSNTSTSANSGSTNTTTPNDTPKRPQPSQVFVPTAAGLQALHPSTLYGMPLNPGKESPNSSSTSLSSTTTEQRKFNAARKRQPAAGYKTPTTSTAYQQSQERISALKKRMQDQRQGRASGASAPGATAPGATAPGATSQSGHSSASGHSASNSAPNSAGSASGSTSGTPRSPALPEFRPRTPLDTDVPSSPTPSSPTSEFLAPLPVPPLSQVEAQWSQILVSAQERILQMGHMRVFVSTHEPPLAPKPPKPAKDAKDAKDAKGGSTGTSGAGSSGAGEREHANANADELDEPVYMLEDDSLLGKVLHTKNKPKLVIVTTQGRLLVLADDRKVQYEILVGVPQIQVTDALFQTPKGRVRRILVQTYNKVLTLDDPGKISSWLGTIDLSRRYYTQMTADQERNAFNAAAAAASAVSGRRR